MARPAWVAIWTVRSAWSLRGVGYLRLSVQSGGARLLALSAISSGPIEQWIDHQAGARAAPKHAVSCLGAGYWQRRLQWLATLSAQFSSLGSDTFCIVPETRLNIRSK
jgi:hypothetical protein